MDYIRRPFHPSDETACIALFDQNCPDYFVLNERVEYKEYLKAQGEEYLLYEKDGHIIGAFGLHINAGDTSTRINWIITAKDYRRSGLGSIMMQEAINRSRKARVIHISASQHSAPFFARFGAIKKNTLENGWGPGMHRIEMEIPLTAPYKAAVSKALV